MKKKYTNINRYADAFQFELQADHHLYTQRFAFTAYGGIKAALKAAILHRDTLRQSLCLPPAIEGVKTTALPYPPSNPITGVSRLSTLNVNGRYSTSWSVLINQQRQAFSTTKYGDEAAFQLACEVRFEACGILQVKGKLPYQPKVAYELVKKQYEKR